MRVEASCMPLSNVVTFSRDAGVTEVQQLPAGPAGDNALCNEISYSPGFTIETTERSTATLDHRAEIRIGHPGDARTALFSPVAIGGFASADGLEATPGRPPAAPAPKPPERPSSRALTPLTHPKPLVISAGWPRPRRSHIPVDAPPAADLKVTCHAHAADAQGHRRVADREDRPDLHADRRFLRHAPAGGAGDRRRRGGAGHRRLRSGRQRPGHRRGDPPLRGRPQRAA